MAYKFFHIPASSSAAAEAELNGFLARYRVQTVDRQFIAAGPPWLSALGKAKRAGT